MPETLHVISGIDTQIYFWNRIGITRGHGILGTFCAARTQQVERMVNKSRRPSGR